MMKIDELIRELKKVKEVFGNKELLICPPEDELDGFKNCHFKMTTSTDWGNRCGLPKEKRLSIDIWDESEEILIYLTEE